MCVHSILVLIFVILKGIVYIHSKLIPISLLLLLIWNSSQYFFLSIEGCISTPHLWGAQDVVVLSCKESFLKNLFGFRILFYIKN